MSKTNIQIDNDTGELQVFTQLSDGSITGSFSAPKGFNLAFAEDLAQMAIGLAKLLGEERTTEVIHVIVAEAAQAEAADTVRKKTTETAETAKPAVKPLVRPVITAGDAPRPAITPAIVAAAWQAIRIDKAISTAAYARKIGVLEGSLAKALTREAMRRKAMVDGAVEAAEKKVGGGKKAAAADPSPKSAPKVEPEQRNLLPQSAK